jgi:alkylhydroperoxidase/carboxymuconolactone decarboxylase family protein YurZ
MGEYTDLIEGLRPSTRELGSAIPEAWGGFAKLHASAVADGKLPARVKELMAMAIAVVKQCDASTGPARGTPTTSSPRR